jgi:hypothetical protein
MLSDYLLGSIVLGVVVLVSFVGSYFLVGRKCVFDLRMGGQDE